MEGPFSTGQPVTGAAAGTKGAMRPVLMALFPEVIAPHTPLAGNLFSIIFSMVHVLR